jgi:hypothetical protein
MHPRYTRAIDIFKPSTSEALTFGRQTVAITIVAYGKPGQALPIPSEAPPAEQPGDLSIRTEPVPIAVPEAVVDNLIEIEGQTVAEPPNLFEQWQGGLHYLQRLLRAGSPADVNRYDVKCFEE